jgi:hypothetical protein
VDLNHKLEEFARHLPRVCLEADQSEAPRIWRLRLWDPADPGTQIDVEGLTAKDAIDAADIQLHCRP